MNDIYVKEADSPYIFSFPHSGMMLSRDMDWQLKPEAQKFLPNVDWHLNELYDFLKKYEVNLISTPFSRYVVDVNRPPDTKIFGNYRDALVYETNAWDEEIYVIPPSEEELARRVSRYHKPYHDELEALINKKVKEFGKVYLIDLHSFMGPIDEDVCLGNRNNSTSSKAFMEQFYDAFNSEGFDTVKNKVFIGGYITKQYAMKDIVETLQIELHYSNYLEAEDLDMRQVPRAKTTLFYETAFRLERVFEKVGIYKQEEEEEKKESAFYLFFLMLCFVLAVSFILIKESKMLKQILLLGLLFMGIKAQAFPHGFIEVKEEIPSIELDIRYLGVENFMGTSVDGYFDAKAILSFKATMALKGVQRELKAFGLGLKVFDAYRPQKAVDHFVRWGRDLDDIKMKSVYYPEVQKKNLFKEGYIAKHSGHSRGSTIDLTLIDLESKVELDMGSSFDLFGKRSWVKYEKIGASQRAHRMLLHTLMLKHGFKAYTQEWWHFTLKNEPYKNYFNFDVK